MKMQWLIDIIVDICKTYTDEQIALQSHVPSGTILAWSGNFGNIPDGWQQCDGTNGTLDLRRKFIWGAGLGNPLYAVGGSEIHSHGAGTNLAAGAIRTASANHVPPYMVIWYIQKL